MEPRPPMVPGDPMRVAVYYRNSDIRLERRPRPAVSEGEVLVEVRASGICGSDVMEWYRLGKAPLVLGHEIAGVIAETGAGVEGYREGDRVFVSHHVPCNTCRECLRGHHTACRTLHTTNFDPGGFAEYIRVPRLNVDRGILRLPDEVSDDEGTFIEPLACVLRSQRLAGLSPGDAVLILGSGISGLLHLLLARALGAGRIVTTDVNEYRLDFARRLGATAALRASEDVPGRLRELNGGRLADLVVVCTGARKAFDQALASVDRGGTVVFFAPTEPGVNLPVPVNDLWRNGVRLLPSYGAAPADLLTSLELIRAKRVCVEDMVTHRLPLERAAEGFRLVAEATESMKVILHP